MPTEAPAKTPTKAPTEDPNPGPERYYRPDRLCPDQKQDGGWRSRPQE